MVAGNAALLLTLYPDHEQNLHGVQFDYFDEVWVCSTVCACRATTVRQRVADDGPSSALKATL